MSPTDREQPTKILYPTDWLPYKIDGQQRMNEDFLAAMEQVLGVQHTKVSLTKLWEEFPPVEAQGKSIAEYLENVSFPTCSQCFTAKAVSLASGQCIMTTITPLMNFDKDMSRSLANPST